MNRKSFTLIELLIAIALSSIVVIALAYFLSTGIDIFTSGRFKAELSSDIEITMNRLARELRQAESISVADSDYIAFTVDLTNDSTDNPVGIEYYYNSATNELVRSE